MQNVTDITNPSAIIKTVRLNANEQKVIASTKSKLEKLTALDAKFRDPYESRAQGQSCDLWDKICSSAAAVENDPSEATFREHLDVLAEVDLLDRHRAGLRDLGNRSAAIARAPLKLIMNAVLDRAVTELERQACIRRESAAAAGMASEFELVLDRVRAAIESHRLNDNPALWLSDYDFITD